MKTKQIVIGAVIFTFIVVVVAYSYYFFQNSINNGNKDILVSSSTGSSLLSNSMFLEAESLMAAGRYKEAIPLYKELLSNTQLLGEDGAIRFRLAIAQTRQEPLLAIENLKIVAADENALKLQRAYAIERLGLMFYRTSDPSLLPVIFSGEPYESFYVEKNTSLALRRLFEYASSIFRPLAISELRVADIYASELISVKGTPTYDGLLNEYLPIIKMKISNAETDIEIIKQSIGSSTVPESLSLRARVFAKLNALGLDYDYETAFKEAMFAGANSNATDASPRIFYAFHLQKYEPSRGDEIVKLLEPIITDINRYPSFKVTFSNEKNNIQGLKPVMVSLANTNADFKDLLLSLGWQEADFIPN